MPNVSRFGEAARMRSVHMATPSNVALDPESGSAPISDMCDEAHVEHMRTDNIGQRSPEE